MRHNKTSSFIILLNVSFLFLLVFIGYHTVQKNFGSQKEPGDVEPLTAKDHTSVKNKSLLSNSALSDYRTIWKRNMFNRSPETLSLSQKQINFANVAEADKKIGLKLVGTVVANVSANRFAIIEINRVQNIFHEGDKTGSYVIKKILRNNVIIDTEDGDKLLALKSEDSDREFAVASSQSSREASTSKKNRVRFKTVDLPRKEIMAAFDDIDRLIRDVGISSYKFGTLTGFKIGSVSNDSILKKIGLRSHDTILALNDKSIKSENEAFEFFERFAEGKKVKIKFRRRNRTRQIELNPI